MTGPSIDSLLEFIEAAVIENENAKVWIIDLEQGFNGILSKIIPGRVENRDRGMVLERWKSRLRLPASRTPRDCDHGDIVDRIEPEQIEA